MNKQSKQNMILLMLVIAAAGIWRWNRPQDSIARSAVAIAPGYSSSDVSDLGIHRLKFEASRESQYKEWRNIFSDDSPSLPVRKPATELPQPIEANRPTLPELPMKYFGNGTVPNGTARRAYLTDGDEIYIVSEGDTVLGRYRILKIGNTALDFEEISSQQRGKKVFEEVGAGS